jgi:hypothetical protein
MHLWKSSTDNRPPIFECETLTEEKKNLNTTALQKGKWPINKKDLKGNTIKNL